MVQELNIGIFKNLKENQIFWEQYKNPFEPLFKNSYDSYLKFNGQESGIKSYNQIIVLLVAFYNEKKLNLWNKKVYLEMVNLSQWNQFNTSLLLLSLFLPW